MKVSELIEALSRYDRDDDVTFYYLKNNAVFIMPPPSQIRSTQLS